MGAFLIGKSWDEQKRRRKWKRRTTKKKKTNVAWAFHLSGSVFDECFPMGSLDLSLGFCGGSNPLQSRVFARRWHGPTAAAAAGIGRHWISLRERGPRGTPQGAPPHEALTFSFLQKGINRQRYGTKQKKNTKKNDNWQITNFTSEKKVAQDPPGCARIWGPDI